MKPIVSRALLVCTALGMGETSPLATAMLAGSARLVKPLLNLLETNA
jgi:hypothetical protein